MPLPIHKMLLQSYKADIKQISSGDDNITIFWVIFVGTVLRWLDTVFQGQYLPSLSINYVTKSKVLEKLPPQLFQIKMKICFDQGSNGIGVVIATK